MSDPVIQFKHVSKRFTRTAGRAAIEDLDFSVRAGEHVCIVGRTGCGKSTSVNLLLGLIPVTTGEVSVLGFDPHKDFKRLRGRIGCVFQSDRLLPWRTAFENVLMPLEVLHRRNPDTENEAMALLGRVGLSGFEHAHPGRLSGGMRQRVALARALITRPDVLIADEAFGHLDEVTAASLRADFQHIARAQGQTVFQITHSLDEALSLADRILVFDRPGRVTGQFERAQWQTAVQRDDVRQTLRHLIAGSAVQGNEPAIRRVA